MDIASVTAQAVAILRLADLAVAALNDTAPFVKLLYQLLVDGKPLTADQRAFLKEQETALRAGLNEDKIAADKD